MKIDPVFPSAPLVNPPKYKFRPVVRNAESSSSSNDEVEGLATDVEVVEDSWPQDVKVLLFVAAVICLTVLFM